MIAIIIGNFNQFLILFVYSKKEAGTEQRRYPIDTNVVVKFYNDEPILN